MEKRLKEYFENPIILMEGNVDEIEEITENPLIFYGAISSVVLDFKIPVIFLNFIEQKFDSPLGPLQTLVRADNPHVIPHEPANFVPIMRDHNRFIAVNGIAAVPLRNPVLIFLQRP